MFRHRRATVVGMMWVTDNGTKAKLMQVDIYRRPEADNKVSYLLVPHGQEIPQEATNTDWALRKQDVHIDETAQHLDSYEIDQPSAQISEKGYAITGVTHQVPVGDGRIP
ncbi:MAG TPA: DUF6139 family protein [Ramlibacter sp.]